MGVPYVTDFARTDEQRRILDLVYSQAVFGRPFLAAPEIPKDRLEALRKAFDQAVADPELLAEAKRINLDIAPLTGSAVEALVASAYATPPDIIENARRSLSVHNRTSPPPWRGGAGLPVAHRIVYLRSDIARRRR